jgi:DNA-binding transcriptional MerR regulator
VRISELSEATGLSVATIKYYLREEILHPGTKVADRLTNYDESHVRRLGLLRLLREVAAVPVERLRDLVSVAADPTVTMHEMFAQAADALSPSSASPTPHSADSRRTADELIERAGWTNVRPDAVDRDGLASVLEALSRYRSCPAGAEEAAPYLDVADRLAREELAHLAASRDADPAPDRFALLEEMIVGQAVYGQLLQVLRRLAQEHHSKTHFDHQP